MKSEFDKEIDALLRRATRDTARREDPLRAAVSVEDATAHLDADELSAYAENALPQTTRTRYMAHLADCDRCRRLATSIALASNVALKSDEKTDAHALAPSETAAASGWRARLAALFAPRTLGYALPVLAVCIVAFIAFIALRDSRDGETQLAKHEPANPNAAAQINAPAEVTTNTTTTTATTNTTDGTLNTNTNTAVSSARQTSADAPPESRPDAPAPKPELSGGTADVSTVTVPAAPVAAPTVGQDARGEFRVEFARPSPSVPPATHMEPGALRGRANTTTTTATTGNTQNRSDVTEHRSDDRADAVAAARARNEASRQEMSKRRGDVAGDEVEERGQAMRRERAPDGSRSSPRARRSGSTESSPEDASGTGATRSVGGHRFRRQDGAWVDVRYNEGMSTTNIRRGTEQFRALAADLPELERIASQLNGEVIVVIGNRAYRIR
ncbi:MAG TPA: zf-HC2 domain-containing protein [Pyrinomonadaceae bacterium]|nr:zf-HC2 domain-containing protein [Pyrinomonadaceae bacterium]